MPPSRPCYADAERDRPTPRQARRDTRSVESPPPPPQPRLRSRLLDRALRSRCCRASEQGGTRPRRPVTRVTSRGIGRIGRDPPDALAGVLGSPPRYADHLVLARQRDRQRPPDRPRRSHDRNPHSGCLALDPCKKLPSHPGVQQGLEPPERPSEKRREAFHLHRDMQAVRAPSNRPARTASEPPTQNLPSTIYCWTETQENRPPPGHPNCVSRKLRQAECRP